MEFAYKADGEKNVAMIALESIIKDFPVSQMSSEDVARKVYGCISDNGIILKYLPNIFE